MTYRQFSYDKSKKNMAELEKTFDELYYLLTDQNTKLSAYEIKIMEEKLTAYSERYQNIKNHIMNIPFKIPKDYDNIFDIVKYASVLFFMSNATIGYSIFSIAFFLQTYYRSNTVIETDKDYEHHMNLIYNTLYNCITNFNKIKNNTNTELRMTQYQFSCNNNNNSLNENRYNIANLIINTYLSIDVPLAKLLEYPEEIQNMVISILQDNLKTDKSSIVTLIVMARQALEKEHARTIEIQNQNMKKSRFKK